MSFILLIVFAMMFWYTGLLLQRCMNKHPLIKSYPDIGEVAFGLRGRAMISTFIYIELFLVAVELLILEGDNLEKLFPHMNFKIGSLRIEGKSGFVVLAALVILPTTWLRSLGALAYVSLGGVMVSIVLIGCVVVCVLFLWCAEKRRSRNESRHRLITERVKTEEISVFIFTFLLSPIKCK